MPQMKFDGLYFEYISPCKKITSKLLYFVPKMVEANLEQLYKLLLKMSK